MDNIGVIIAIIAFVIGLQAFSQWMYLRSNEKLIKTYNEKFDQVLKNKNLLNNNQTNFFETVDYISSILQTHGSLIVRILHDTKSPIVEKVAEEIQNYIFMLDKSIHEINLFSSNPIEFQTAVKALSEEFGDIESLQLMIKCNVDIYSGKNDDLIIGINTIQERIDPNFKRRLWFQIKK